MRDMSAWIEEGRQRSYDSLASAKRAVAKREKEAPKAFSSDSVLYYSRRRDGRVVPVIVNPDSMWWSYLANLFAVWS